MAKFITGDNLIKAIDDIIWEAKDNLLIVSPYIKLDSYFKELFQGQMNRPKLRITIVFGKNEGDVSKSLSKDDFSFFMGFSNVSIVYVPNLHAKYYGNELKGVITSINLYDHSFKNNIEFGVFSEVNLLDRFSPSSDMEAWRTALDLAETNEAVFIKRPVFEKALFGGIFGKNYVNSEILHDVTDKFYGLGSNRRNPTIKGFRKTSDFPDELILGTNNEIARPSRADFVKEETAKKKYEPERKPQKQNGYCIRTGVEIPFNPNRPLSESAYKSWVQYENPDFKEKYCHKTGKPSYGKTSMRNPVL
jgi:hypothetical protein